MRICFVLLILFISYANAQEAAKVQDNTRTSVYFHPISLSSNIFYTVINALYSTIEIPSSLSNSLIIKPSLLREHTDLVLLKLGSDIGMRHYLFKKGKGLYLQEQVGVFYYKRTYVADGGDTYFSILTFHETRIKGLWFDTMGYLGYSWKLSKVSIFTDIGFGVAAGMNHKNINISPLPDFNLGIGIPI
ncbi:MAG: hypothetical protein FWF63_04380 [Fibromonadales bacterium]|nr:hypothetical protein [Fibromonadales bacterium]